MRHDDSGILFSDEQRAWRGLVLFAGSDGYTHLIDHDGIERRRWPRLGFPPRILPPERAGDVGMILTQHGGDHRPEGAAFNSIFDIRGIAISDWSDTPTWTWHDPEGRLRPHHDWYLARNGDLVLLAAHDRVIPAFSGAPVAEPVIVRVSGDGLIRWTWRAGDHVDELDLDAPGRALLLAGYTTSGGTRQGGTGFLGLNSIVEVGPNRWHETGDARFHPDNIIVTSREANSVFVVDHLSGRIVWTLGPSDFPSPDASPLGRLSASGLPRPVDQISGPQAAHLIPAGLPGEGNLLLLDTQSPAGLPQVTTEFIDGSRVLEIDPASRSIQWQYTAELSGRPLWTFRTSVGGDAQRLPNGTTLITECVTGRIFQVDPHGELVWEYRSPYTGRGYYATRREVTSNQVPRVQAVPHEWLPDLTA